MKKLGEDLPREYKITKKEELALARARKQAGIILKAIFKWFIYGIICGVIITIIVNLWFL